jgi:hypothetical protein
MTARRVHVTMVVVVWIKKMALDVNVQQVSWEIDARRRKTSVCLTRVIKDRPV